MRFCKTSQISQKTSNTESVFRKTISPQTCNRNKNDTITGVFLWIYLCEYIYSFLLFLEKAKAATRDVLWNLVFLKITGKHMCWISFKRTHILRNTCERLLLNINICLTATVLLHRRIKLLNSNVNKKKNMCEYLTSGVTWHKNCRR